LIEAVAAYFRKSGSEAGRDALGYYHERKDEHRDFGLGPEHDCQLSTTGNCVSNGARAQTKKEKLK
jgi:hypothetical protein